MCEVPFPRSKSSSSLTLCLCQRCSTQFTNSMASVELPFLLIKPKNFPHFGFLSPRCVENLSRSIITFGQTDAFVLLLLHFPCCPLFITRARQLPRLAGSFSSRVVLETLAHVVMPPTDSKSRDNRSMTL